MVTAQKWIFISCVVIGSRKTNFEAETCVWCALICSFLTPVPEISHVVLMLSCLELQYCLCASWKKFMYCKLISHAAWLCLDLSSLGWEHRSVKLLKFRVVGSVILWLLSSAASSAYLPFSTLNNILHEDTHKMHTSTCRHTHIQCTCMCMLAWRHTCVHTHTHTQTCTNNKNNSRNSCYCQPTSKLSTSSSWFWYSMCEGVHTCSCVFKNMQRWLLLNIAHFRILAHNIILLRTFSPLVPCYLHFISARKTLIIRDGIEIGRCLANRTQKKYW